MTTAFIIKEIEKNKSTILELAEKYKIGTVRIFGYGLVDPSSSDIGLWATEVENSLDFFAFQDDLEKLLTRRVLVVSETAGTSALQTNKAL